MLETTYEKLGLKFLNQKLSADQSYLTYDATIELTTLGATQTKVETFDCASFDYKCPQYYYKKDGYCSQETCPALTYLDTDGICKQEKCEKFYFLDVDGRCK